MFHLADQQGLLDGVPVCILSSAVLFWFVYTYFYIYVLLYIVCINVHSMCENTFITLSTYFCVCTLLCAIVHSNIYILEVWDAYSQRKRTMALEFLFDHEDSQGVQKVLGSCGVGSKVGGCPWCKVHGCVVYPGTTNCYYMNAVRFLPPDDPLRELFRTEFQNNRDLAALADLPRPEVMTTEEAIASAERVQEKISTQTDEYYKFVSPFYSYFRTDVVPNTTIDPCHAIGKSIEHLFCLMFTTANCQMTFSESMKEYEMKDLGRWDDGFPFRASPLYRKLLGELLPTLPKPKQWGRIHHWVEKPKTSKVHPHKYTLCEHRMYLKYIKCTYAHMLYYILTTLKL